MSMKKIVYPISMNYVKHWGVSEGLRELYQNAIDGGDWTSEWDEDKGQLCLMNKNQKLERSVLLFGEGTKRNDAGAIGTFGEGLKLAMLALLRNGCCLTITNDDEQWLPRIEWNDDLNAQVLVVSFLEGCEGIGGFEVMVHGLDQNYYENYVELNLHLAPKEMYQTDVGEVLLEMEMSGKIFVSGLYITECDDYLYGFNFKAGKLPLGRDRSHVNESNVASLAGDALSEMFRNGDGWERSFEELTRVGDSRDYYWLECRSSGKEYETYLWEEYRKVYSGAPVSSEHDGDELRLKYDGLSTSVVPFNLYKMLIRTDEYAEYLETFEKIEVLSLREMVEEVLSSIIIEEGMATSGEMLLEKFEEVYRIIEREA